MIKTSFPFSKVYNAIEYSMLFSQKEADALYYIYANTGIIPLKSKSHYTHPEQYAMIYFSLLCDRMLIDMERLLNKIERFKIKDLTQCLEEDLEKLELHEPK